MTGKETFSAVRFQIFQFAICNSLHSEFITPNSVRAIHESPVPLTFFLASFTQILIIALFRTGLP